MNFKEVTEFYFITSIRNIPSILKRGILCFEKAEKIPHHSIAMDEIQERRKKVVVPGGMPLHKYANLYICARNPMMYKRRDQHEQICILRISLDVLNLPKVVISDGNASSDYTKFLPASKGIEMLDLELVFAEYWTDPDYFEALRKKRIKCAEVLVPDKVAIDYIFGAYVSGETVKNRMIELGFNKPVTIRPNPFFR